MTENIQFTGATVAIAPSYNTITPPRRFETPSARSPGARTPAVPQGRRLQGRPVEEIKMSLNVEQLLRSSKIGDKRYFIWCCILPFIAFIAGMNEPSNYYTRSSPMWNYIPFMIAGFIVGMPFALAHKHFASRALIAKHKEKGANAFKTYIGKSSKYMNVSVYTTGHYVNFSGIAYDGNTFYVAWDNNAARITYDVVRSWAWRIEGFSTTQVFDASSNAVSAARAANVRSAHAAAIKSGFFVNVADIDYPSWHFQTTDEAVLRKWDEIFKQHKEGVNRSQVAVAA